MGIQRIQLVFLLAACCIGSLVVATAASNQAEKDKRYIIKFKSNAHRRGLGAIQRYGIRTEVEDSRYEFAAAYMSKVKKDALMKNPNVQYIEDDPIRELIQFQLPFQTVTAGAQTVPFGVNMVLDGFIDPDKGAAYATTNVYLCIIDSGYDRTHEDLPTAKVSGVNDMGSGTWFEDSCQHGTHVAGTAVALNNSRGVVGVIPNLGRVALHIVKVFGADSGDSCEWTYSSSLISALSQCQARISPTQKLVVSMSLGGSYYSWTENNAFENAYNTGRVISVAAAGNRGTTEMTYPGSYPSVISVGCVDQNRALCYFSQRNSEVDLVAPGMFIISTTQGNTYTIMAGTSMSTPHVSAAAALLWGFHPNCNNADIIEALRKTAQDLGAPGRDNSYGFGLISVHRAYDWLIETNPNASIASTPNPSSFPSPSRTKSPTPTRTKSPTPTRTKSPTPTRTKSPTPTRTKSPTPTRTKSPTPTRTKSPTPTRTKSPTPTRTKSPVPRQA